MPVFLIFRLFDFELPTLTLPKLIEPALIVITLPRLGATLTGVGGEVGCAVAVTVGVRVGVGVSVGVEWRSSRPSRWQ